MSSIPVGAGAADMFVGLSSPDRSGRLSWQQITGLCVMLTGTFMAIMDVFIVNVAVPSIRADLGADFAQVEFIIAGYGLTYTLALITCGRLGDIYGRRCMFMAGLMAFVATSALCGAAPTPSLIRVAFTDPRQRALAFSAMGAVISSASFSSQRLIIRAPMG